MIIIEAILTIFAWRNGWKWLSLLPIGICVLLGFLMGIFIGVSGGEVTQNVLSFAVIFDIIAIIVLIYMIATKPKTTKEN